MDSASDDEHEELIRKELSDIPLGELQEIRSKIGTKKFDTALKESQRKREAGSFKRVNKNRPSEISSKKPVPRFREVVPVQKSNELKRDPRFDDRAGNFNEDLFKKSFSFIEEMKKNEKELVIKEVKKTRNPERKNDLKKYIQKIESKEAAIAEKDKRRAVMREHKKIERELISKGKKPFHIKKSTQKKIELAQKYMKLKKSGGLDKFMSKKRKKNASRDRKMLPFRE